MRTANPVAKNYGLLSPEERFRLILAASERKDDAERDRLARAGERLLLSMAGHAPYAEALTELGPLTYIELLEEAARYFDALDRADDARDWNSDEKERDDSEADDAAGDEGPAWQRMFDLALAAGYMLRAKADGWKLFCERLGISPFLLWEGLPGLDRLQRALKLTERTAFAPEGFLRWLNRIRPESEPELTEVPLTAERAADANEAMFRDRVEWWSG